ncbi:MAG: hypothetical protein ACR2KO_06795 [Geodermatophilaceae bacterium]
MSDDPARSVHPLNSSPDRLALAEFDAGLPDEVTVARASVHVEGCTECQAVLDALHAVRADVGRLAGTPMPSAVAARIAAALAAGGVSEPGSGREHTTGAERTETGWVSEPAEPSFGRHRAAEMIELRSARRIQRLRVAAGLAAGLVLLGGVGYLSVQGIGTGGDAATSAVGGDSAEEGAGDAGTDALPSYDRQSLEAAVGDLLEGSPVSTDEQDGVPDTTTADAGQDAESAVDPDCLARIPVATAEALSIDRVSYEGQSAIVVIFAGDPGQVQVTVVSDCADGAVPAVIVEFDADR